MKTECSLVQDLLPLFAENMVREETARYLREHLSQCPHCRAEYEALKTDPLVLAPEASRDLSDEQDETFTRLLKKLNRWYHYFACLLILLLLCLGFSWTGGENLMYNSLLMPVVGVFGYTVFRWKSLYKVPLLLLAVEVFLYVFGLVEVHLPSAILWTLLYSLFVFAGIVIAFLLHFAFRKEKES